MVQTEAPSPKFESLARASASASSATTITGTTGPKISSLMIRISSVDPGEHGRGDEAAGVAGDLAWPAGDQIGSGRDRVVDQPGDEVCLLGGDHRPDLGLPVERIADREPLGLAPHPVEETVGDRLDDVGSLDPRAGLAGVGEPAPDAARDGVREVGVRADDLRILAAELEHASLEPLGADLADLAADLDRAGEEDLLRSMPRTAPGRSRRRRARCAPVPRGSRRRRRPAGSARRAAASGSPA